MFPVPEIVVFDVTVVPDVVPYVPCLRHIVCTSLPAVPLSLWTPILFPVPKILVIDVTVVLDVVLDVDLIKIYCLHVIPIIPMVTVDPNCG